MSAINLPLVCRATARLLDLRGAFFSPVVYVYRRPKNNRSGLERDQEALASDWRAVSSDIASAIERLRLEYPEQARSLPPSRVQPRTGFHAHRQPITRRPHNRAKDPAATR